jgi:hypothetical protein
MKLLIMQSSPVSSHFLPLTSKYSPEHPVRDKVSHPYKIAGKIIVLYILKSREEAGRHKILN